MEIVDMRPLANIEDFILVYPQGSLLGNTSHWNSCPPIENNKSLVDDFGFIEKMITQIISKYNVDRERIYAIGYSNGGMMAYGLAHYKSELIAGIASVSGVMLDCFGTTNHPMPIIHLHGTLDFVLPQSTRRMSANDNGRSISRASIYGFPFSCIEALGVVP